MRGLAIQSVAVSSGPAFATAPSPGWTPEPQVIRFGPFDVFPGARALLRDGQPVYLGSRAFDLLMVLLRARGRIVTKAEIMRYVWPSTFVDDANLRVQMAALRKALEDNGTLIKTVSGRGYLAIQEGDEVGGCPGSSSGPRGAVLQKFRAVSARNTPALRPARRRLRQNA